MNAKINTNDIIMAIGYDNTSANEAILSQAKTIADIANKIAEPNYSYKIVKIKKITDNNVILENNDVLSCKSLATATKNCTHLLLAVMTVGHKIDNAIKEAFSSDDYINGMMLDAAGTGLVANYSKNMWHEFIKILDDGMGITEGFSPGSQDFDLENQKVIFNNLNLKSIDLKLSDSFLMIPAKSVSVVYGIGKEIDVSCVSRSCKNCSRKDCMMRDNREVEIKVYHSGTQTTIKSPIGEKLVDLLKDNKIYIDLPCNGRGTCGSCDAKFVKLIPKATENDITQLSKKQIEDGYRLTCQVKVAHPLELFIEHEEMQILSDEKSGDTEVYKHAIAVDIGTTTIVCHLIDADDGNIIDTVASTNNQRSFGADVASRILHEMSDENGKEQLNQSIVGQLSEMIKTLKAKNDVSKIENITAVGNTIMTHILLGHETKGLGAAPYTPVSLERVTLPCSDLSIDEDCDITVIEGLASYVGSDVLVGAAVCDLMKDDEYSILIDLGTNGEIALGNSEKLFSCATAAGPAFEAVNVHSGMSGLPGAVSEFSYANGKYSYKTISNKPPLGICGSGVLDITATLLRQGIVDLTGRMLRDAEGVLFDENLKEHFKIAEG
ncbi:MAG: DUF4445 domain-containing protein, partial [Clostridiales bacterium]|nr:DUF4445 domain-containing protein [Clostridiales bacterium]